MDGEDLLKLKEYWTCAITELEDCAATTKLGVSQSSQNAAAHAAVISQLARARAELAMVVAELRVSHFKTFGVDDV